MPTEIEINGEWLPIETDFRFALIAIEACSDPNLTDLEKMYVTLDALFGIENISRENLEEAYKKAVWFLDGGIEQTGDEGKRKPKLMDFVQDEQMIFSAVNDVARCETRVEPYIHWWTFLGYFNEIREGLFSNVLAIRQKKAKKKKLDKHEQEFYRNNKELIDLKARISDAEKQAEDELNRLLGE